MLTIGIWVLIILFAVAYRDKLAPLKPLAHEIGKTLAYCFWLGFFGLLIYGWIWITNYYGWHQTAKWVGGIFFVPLLAWGIYLSVLDELEKQKKVLEKQNNSISREKGYPEYLILLILILFSLLCLLFGGSRWRIKLALWSIVIFAIGWLVFSR